MSSPTLSLSSKALEAAVARNSGAATNKRSNKTKVKVSKGRRFLNNPYYAGTPLAALAKKEKTPTKAAAAAAAAAKVHNQVAAASALAHQQVQSYQPQQPSSITPPPSSFVAPVLSMPSSPSDGANFQPKQPAFFAPPPPCSNMTMYGSYGNSFSPSPLPPLAPAGHATPINASFSFYGHEAFVPLQPFAAVHHNQQQPHQPPHVASSVAPSGSSNGMLYAPARSDSLFSLGGNPAAGSDCIVASAAANANNSDTTPVPTTSGAVSTAGAQSATTTDDDAVSDSTSVSSPATDFLSCQQLQNVSNNSFGAPRADPLQQQQQQQLQGHQQQQRHAAFGEHSIMSLSQNSNSMTIAADEQPVMPLQPFVMPQQPQQPRGFATHTTAAAAAAFPTHQARAQPTTMRQNSSDFTPAERSFDVDTMHDNNNNNNNNYDYDDDGTDVSGAPRRRHGGAAASYPPNTCFVVVMFKHELCTFQCPFFVVDGDWVVVQADRGEHIGRVRSVAAQPPAFHVPSRILRHANFAEIAAVSSAAPHEQAAAARIQQLASEMGLPLRIVDTEFYSDGNKMTIFFSSKTTVDFRELQRVVFREFRRRIWLINLAEVQYRNRNCRNRK